jgi:NAD(P)-dependent dehydrogenase (short-subunit alcohol dehydrogenase family)
MSEGYPLRGKVALVTGAARGIGFETARIAHERGASVAVLDLEEEAAADAARRIGERTLAIGADVTDAEAMAAAVDRTVAEFGGLDVPVANAGIAPPAATIRATDPDVFERTIEIDLLGVWRTVRPALDQVAERGGHVVVVSSVYAWVNGAAASPYAISKAGVEQMGRALRAELKPHGASATTAHFGFVDTVMVQKSFESDLAEEYEKTMPVWLRRRITPAAAGKGIVDGIERRADRVILPRWWRGYMLLQGILNPILDRAMAADDDLLNLMRRADEPERAADRGGIEHTAGKNTESEYSMKGNG